MPSRSLRLSREDRVELEHVLRGVGGGVLFSIPILYTMEIWELALSTPPWKILLLLALMLPLNTALNYASGFREEARWHLSLRDACEALAMGIVLGAAMLLLLGVNRLDTHPAHFLRQVLLLAVPISIGVSLSRSVLGEKGEASAGEPTRKPQSGWRADARDMGMTVAGGIFLGYSVAPTEEIMRIAAHSSWGHLLAMMAAAIGVSYVILFEANFLGQSRRTAESGLNQSPWRETLIAYALALGVSVFLLFFLGFLTASASAYEALAMTIVLAFPTAVGGAAGRLIV